MANSDDRQQNIVVTLVSSTTYVPTFCYITNYDFSSQCVSSAGSSGELSGKGKREEWSGLSAPSQGEM